MEPVADLACVAALVRAAGVAFECLPRPRVVKIGRFAGRIETQPDFERSLGARGRISSPRRRSGADLVGIGALHRHM